jgi:hypothetical protein
MASLLRRSCWLKGLRLAGWFFLSALNLVVYSVSLRCIQEIYNFDYLHVVGLIESVFAFLVTLPFVPPAPPSVTRGRIFAASLISAISQGLTRSARFLTTNSNAALSRWISLFAVARFEPHSHLSRRLFGVLILLVAGSACFSLGHVTLDFWGVLVSLTLAVVYSVLPLHLFDFAVTHHMTPACVIHECARYMAAFHIVMIFPLDFASDRTLSAFQPSIGWGVVLGLTVTMSAVVWYCDLRNLFETSPVSFQVVQLLRTRIMKVVVVLVTNPIDVSKEPITGRIAAGIVLLLAGFGAFLVIKAREESRIGQLPTSLQP